MNYEFSFSPAAASALCCDRVVSIGPAGLRPQLRLACTRFICQKDDDAGRKPCNEKPKFSSTTGAKRCACPRIFSLRLGKYTSGKWEAMWCCLRDLSIDRLICPKPQRPRRTSWKVWKTFRCRSGNPDAALQTMRGPRKVHEACMI